MNNAEKMLALALKNMGCAPDDAQVKYAVDAVVQGQALDAAEAAAVLGPPPSLMALAPTGNA